jgi:Family of unknown function (DUF6522)
MSALSSSAVTIEDGEITIAADLLAQQLGLSVEALKEQTRRGYVYSLAEQGVAEDPGRTRLTFRYRTARGPWWSNRIARWSRPRSPATMHRQPPASPTAAAWI